MQRFLAKKPAPVEAERVEISLSAEGPGPDATPPNGQAVVVSPLSAARSGGAQVPVFDRGAPQDKLWPELWLEQLVDAALDAAVTKRIHLALIWPGEVKSVSLIHALATLERLAIGDKKGLRGLMYPTKRPSFAVLGQLLLDTERLGEWTRRYQTATKLAPGQSPIEGRDDPNKEMLLWAVQQIKNNPPAIAEVFPHFDWSIEHKSWGHYGARFLSRTKRALIRDTKRELWKDQDDGRINQLGDPATAPDAIFGVSHLSNAGDRKAAFRSDQLHSVGRQPELVILDGTREIQRTTDKNLAQQLPEVMSEIAAAWGQVTGGLIVTDDPKVFFTLRKRLPASSRQELVTHTLLSLRDDYGLAKVPLARGIQLPQVSMRNFRVGVLDQETGAAANLFWQVAGDLQRDCAASVACRFAGMFLLRLASLPAGYRHYASWVSAKPYSGLVNSVTTWNGHEATLLRLVEQGDFGHRAEKVRRAITRAQKLVTAYNEATPIALRLTKEVAACAHDRRATIAVAFRFNDDIPLAEGFLGQHQDYPDGFQYEDVKGRVRLINHRELPDILTSEDAPSSLVLVGLPNSSLRFLLTSERIPQHIVIIVDYRRADDLAVGLRALQTLDAYKAFRGRIAGLAAELERRIEEMPKLVDLDKLLAMPQARLSLASAASDASRQAAASPDSWRVVVEGDIRIAVGTRVYVYDPDEDVPFRSRNTSELKEGDLVFIMSEALKDMFETCLISVGKPIVRGSSFGEMVKHYHRDVLSNAARLFGSVKPAALARAIKDRMAEIDPRGEKCSVNRIRYWTDIQGSGEAPAEDLKPHSTWSREDFVLFAKALEIAPNLIPLYWDMVINQRRALQEAGRELADRYAHVLFNEETARLHYELSPETISRLQHEAVRNTHCVIKTIPPSPGVQRQGR